MLMLFQSDPGPACGGAVGRRIAETLTVAAALACTFLAGVVPAGPATAAPGVYAVVCPEAPPGTQPFMDDVTGWVKWGVLALIVIAAVVSIGSILAGRIFSHPHASRYGAIGLVVTVVAAILYVVIPGMLSSITGTGCT